MKRLLLYFLFVSFFFVSQAQTIFYVKSGASGDGSSWSSSTGDLQSAIDAAATAAESSGESAMVYVAEGYYYPVNERISGDPRSASFIMKKKVEIYGGFRNTGDPVFADRDPENNQTILSGDIGTADDISDNVYQLIRNNFDKSSPLDQSAILDGFTIEGGNPEGGSNIYGTAIYCYYASPIIRNCIFAGEGGSLLCFSRSQPVLTGCEASFFSGDMLIYMGTGAETAYTELTMSNCRFYDNETDDPLLFLSYYTQLHMDSCEFVGNQSNITEISWYSNILIENSLFEDNYGSNGVGTVLNLWSTTESDYYVIRNSVFKNNTSSSGGGVVYATSSDPLQISNSLFYNNVADGHGGAIYAYSTDVSITNCTFYNNSTEDPDDHGAAIANANYFSGDLVVDNCILWGDRNDQLYESSSAESIVSNSDIKLENPEETFSGSNNINTDPLFTDAASGDLTLLSNSPCINTGSNDLYTGDFLYVVDLAGNPRIYEDGIIDMGCFEYQGEKTELSVDEAHAARLVSVYPNPAVSTLEIASKNGTVVQKLQIFDLSGKLVLQNNHPSGFQDVTSLENGSYILELQLDSGRFSQLFIKQ